MLTNPLSIAILFLAGAAAAQTESPLRGVITTPCGDLPFVMTAILGPYRICHGDHEQGVGWRRVARPPYAIDFAPGAWIEHGAMENGQQQDWDYRGTWTTPGLDGPLSLPFRWEHWPMLKDTADANRRLHGPLFTLRGEPWDPSGRWSVQFATEARPTLVELEPSRNDWIRGPGEVQVAIPSAAGSLVFAGTARGDELRLAHFDGVNAVLLVGKRQRDGTLIGEVWGRGTGRDVWVARREAAAAVKPAAPAAERST